MMIGKIGLDTSILIDFFKGEDSAVAFITKNISLLEVSELVVFEFLCGNLNKKDHALFLDAIAVLDARALDRQTMLLASSLFKEGRKKGKMVGGQDCLIAASYLSKGTKKIVTRNKKHFEQMPGIEVVGY